MAGRADGRPRQPRAAARGDQGRRAPGVVGVDGRDHDGAVVRPPRRRRQGRRQAARLARVPRHQVPHRRARPLVPHPAARARRAAVVPEPHEGPRRRPTSRPAPSASASSPRCSPRRHAATSTHTSAPATRPRRPAFIALAGDAELDEGNVWEAITDPALQGLGNVMLVVDTNRQSLDRVVPDQKIKKLMEFFDGAGWHVVEAKYGRAAHGGVRPPGRRRPARATSTQMSNEEYQSLFAHSRRGAARALPRHRRRRGARSSSTTCPTTTSPRSCRTSAATTSACCSTLPGVRRRGRPPERRVRLHRQGLGPADRRRSAEPRRPPHGGADRRAARPGRPHAGDRVGPLRPRRRRRDGCARRPAAS